MTQTAEPTAEPAADYTCPLCTTRALTCDGDCLATLHQATAPKEGSRNKPTFGTKATGPRTPVGKAVAARNATTHGLFARDVVLPSFGEDPDGYAGLEREFTAQLGPRNLLERHYVEKIAAASWRLRRLHRWQAQIFEDEELREDERLDRLDKVLRHETALHRQIDTAVKMLSKDVPLLYKTRARDQALLVCMQTEVECRENRENELEVEYAIRERLMETEEATTALDYVRLGTPQDCQNEPAPASSPVGSAAPTPPPPAPGGVAGLPAGVGSDPPQEKASPNAPTDFGIMGVTRNGYLVTSESARTGRMVRLAPRDDEDLFR